MNPPLPKSPRVLLFDLFGTLVTIRNKRAPYRQLLAWAKTHRALPEGFDALDLMRQPLTIEDVAARLTVPVPPEQLKEWQLALGNELASVELTPGVEETLPQLVRGGYVLGVCSNLAAPYGPPALACLATLVPLRSVLSFEVGAVKPEPTIYAKALEVFGCNAADVLFVGDTWTADVAGPRSAGMAAVWVAQGTAGTPAPCSIATIADLPEYLTRTFDPTPTTYTR